MRSLIRLIWKTFAMFLSKWNGIFFTTPEYGYRKKQVSDGYCKEQGQDNIEPHDHYKVRSIK